MKTLMFTTALLFSFKVSFGQITRSSDFVYLTTNSQLTVHNLDLKKTLTGYAYFEADEGKFNVNEVKFFRNFSGYYANLKSIDPTYSVQFALKVHSGEFNFYQLAAVCRDTGSSGYGHYRSYDNVDTAIVYYHIKAGDQSYSTCYYNKGYGNLKELNLYNLKTDLDGNSASLKCLKYYRLKGVSANVFSALGCLGFLGGCFGPAMYFGTSGKGSWMGAAAVSLSCFTTSVICFRIGSKITRSKNKDLSDAISAYEK